MNVVRIMGGLGNQLFQYAFGKAQMQNGIDVKFDLSWFAQTKRQKWPRPYRLDKYHVEVGESPFLRQRLINEVRLGFVQDSMFLKIDNSNFEGYWQHPVYYTGIQDVLQKDFKIRKEFLTKEFLELKNKVANCNSVSIHVRRGDYVEIPRHHVLPLDYYKRAMDIVKGEYFIFSDDQKWCRENFKNATFVHMEDYLDMELMKYCRNNIIANSTLSWWGAWLNETPDKKVIMPNQWRITKNALESLTRDFVLPNGWLEI